MTSLQNLERQLILTTVRGNDVCSRQKHPDELGERHRKSGGNGIFKEDRFHAILLLPIRRDIRQAALGTQEKIGNTSFQFKGAGETNGQHLYESDAGN